MRKLLLIAIFFLSACGDLVENSVDASVAEDMIWHHPEIKRYGSGGTGGTLDKCSAAECNAPLDRRPFYSNPSKGEQ